MAQNRVFVSPGVYTSEKEILFVNRQIGVTSVGLVGETVKGPAFQPIFISNYDEFRRFFGGLNPKKISDGAGGFYPQYELPYIAKSYLSKSNQLYVTRVLGLTGYNAGLSWALALDSNIDLTSVTESSSNSITLTYDINLSGATLENISDSNIEDFYNLNLLNSQLVSVSQSGTTLTQTQVFTKINETDFNGISFTGTVTSVSTSGNTRSVEAEITYSLLNGIGYEDVEGMVIALLRSRGRYSTNGLDFDILESTDVILNNVNAINDPYGDFTLSGTTQINPGTFSHVVSLDKTKRNYITKVLGTNEKDGKTSLFVEEIFINTLKELISANKVRGIKTTLVSNGDNFSDYKQEFSPAVTPYVVSELRDDKVLKLFRFITISDGNTANTEVKFSITNINLDSRTFDVIIRAYNDTDANPIILERFSKCSMNPNSNDYIARKIGTLDGEYVSRSNYVLVEMDTDADTSESFPAGFLGYPTRDYSGIFNSTNISYKTKYSILENKRKVFLGMSSIIGIDNDVLKFKGVENVNTLTDGFHMDADATLVKIDLGTQTNEYKMAVSTADFKSESTLIGTDYENINSRKFTFAAYGGFDGWDIYRDSRTNNDAFVVNQFLTEDGYDEAKLTLNNLAERVNENGERITNSDYYAYLEGIRTFANPEAVNINVFATPGLDYERNSILVSETIEMVETERADSVYIITAPNKATESEAVDALEDSGVNSNYSATYWPWKQYNDTENNVYVNLPITVDVIRNIAITDNVAFPWYAVAGVQRGDVECVRVLKKLTEPNRDILYAGRINPVATWSAEGVKIWGNKTLTLNEDSPLSSLNVRRLLLHTRKLISAVSIRLLFDQNDAVVRQNFTKLVNPILENIRSERGLTEFKVELDNSQESIDRKEMTGRILIKPTPALEYIVLEFGITNTGANFDNI